MQEWVGDTFKSKLQSQIKRKLRCRGGLEICPIQNSSHR